MGSISGLYECISCRHPFSFRHADSQLLVCPSCYTPHQRNENDKLVAKAILVVQYHNDIIKVGTTGSWRKINFEVIGRIRYWLGDGALNYWTLLADDSRLYYLAESYGVYSILEKYEDIPRINLNELNKAGDTTLINGSTRATLDKRCSCIHYEIEGEVWDLFQQSNQTFYDLNAATGQNISVATNADGFTAFRVHDCSFESLKLQHLDEGPPTPKLFKCPRCHDEITIKTFPYAQSYGCSCGAKLQLAHSSGLQEAGQFKPRKYTPDIAPGKTGIIKGINYEVIGFSVKRDTTQDEGEWREYVLYNRQEGYAFLNEYEGNWIYSREKGEAPAEAAERSSHDFIYRGTHFRLYNRYGYKIREMQGEYPGKVFGLSYAYEFIAPPLMWVAERESEVSVCYFQAEYISREDVLHAFSVPLPDSREMGVLSPPFLKPSLVLKKAIIAAGVLLLVHLIFSLTRENGHVLTESYSLPDTATVQSPVFVTGSFTLPNWRNNLEITTTASVSNDWMDIDYEVVNTQTGEEYGLSQEVSYYAGYEDGESWTEGGTTSSPDVISNLPAGQYFIRIQHTGSGSLFGPKHFQVTVNRNVAVHSNFFLFLVLVLLWPTYAYLRSYWTDRRRWYNSEFSPYEYE
ncbi:DUF4178 domain-containing protein [Filimonas effusa]|uniref:DUF4178 domain-containing protein n=1 Tax=Filimonas effusa TaxID=2508721 RepID=A0A4Q1DCJ1_9BACT|nr:DUF4178 domain-containing protein [Filimonas effusa]RXK87080.1 DUF4178 domain-containing protein [Filimonas effusa]